MRTGASTVQTLCSCLWSSPAWALGPDRSRAAPVKVHLCLPTMGFQVRLQAAALGQEPARVQSPGAFSRP